jgi:glutathione peroxidase
MSEKTAFNFVVDRLTGGILPLKEFAGRPMVIVNTASKCGFTPQYAALETLWNANRAHGLVVLGVPSNDFGGQEPGTAGEIAAFCTNQYNIDFPMAAKVSVKGTEAHPLFQWLAAEGGFFARPRWNFYKYLIGRDGRFRTWFSSLTAPGSARFKAAVADLVARS